MLKNDSADSITISAVQPDLNFPKNEKKKNGFDNYSRLVELKLTLKGNWELKEGAEVQSVHHTNGETIVRLECRHGFSSTFGLVKI